MTDAPDVVDVRDFPGVDLDGRGDSTAGMQLAVDQAAAAGRRLFVPAGVVVCARVFLRSGIHIVGAGSRATILRLPPASEYGILTATDGSGAGVDDVTLAGFTLDGDRAGSQVQGTGAAALLHGHVTRRWHVSRLRIMNGRGYGFGWQGRPSNPDPAKRGPQTDLYMEFCELHDNGYLPDGSSNSTDNLDIKHAERVVLNSVLATGASDKGFNVRGRYTTLTACRAYGCGVGFDMNSVDDPSGHGALDSFHTMLGCAAEANRFAGFAVSATANSVNHADLVGCVARRNRTGVVAHEPGPGEVRLSVSGGKFLSNARHGVRLEGVSRATISGASCSDNGIDGIHATDVDGATFTANDIHANGGHGIRSDGRSDRIIATANQIRHNGAGALELVGSANVVAGNVVN